MHPGAMKGGSFHKTEKAKFGDSLKHQQIGGGHLSDPGVMCGGNGQVALSLDRCKRDGGRFHGSLLVLEI